MKLSPRNTGIYTFFTSLFRSLFLHTPFGRVEPKRKEGKTRTPSSRLDSPSFKKEDAAKPDRDPASQRSLESGIARGRWQLAGVMLVAAVLWGIVFPAISESDSHRAAMLQLEDRGIDPMALFYTDHPSTSGQLLKEDGSDVD